MEVVKKIEIDYGHRVPNHESKCFSPHGHRGVVEVCLEGDIVQKEGDPAEGMVIDFGDIKKGLVEVVDQTFDHAFVVYEKDQLVGHLQSCAWLLGREFKLVIVPYVPTAENMANHIFELLLEYYKDKFGDHLRLAWVKFYETPNSWVIAC